jgi:hypothetical protein
MIRRLSLFTVPAFLVAIVLSSPGCDDDALEGEFQPFHSMTGDEVSITSHPTISSGSGKVLIDTPWYPELEAWTSAVGPAVAVKLSNSKSTTDDGGMYTSPGRIRVVVRGKLGPQTFTSFRTTEYYASAPGEPEGLDIGLEDRSGDESTRGEGTVVVEDLTFERQGEGAHVHARMRFDNVRIWTRGKDALGEPKEYESVISGTLDVTGDDKPPPPAPSGSGGGSSSGGSRSGGSSSGGAANCPTSVWTCPYDGQATPTCQYACTFAAGSTQRKQSCAVLQSMLESNDPSQCCGSICQKQ